MTEFEEKLITELKEMRLDINTEVKRTDLLERYIKDRADDYDQVVDARLTAQDKSINTHYNSIKWLAGIGLSVISVLVGALALLK